MNGFVPALVAILLAELGLRIDTLATARRRERVLWVVALLVFVAGAGGTLVAPMLTAWADLLMIGVALTFAGIGQLQRVRARTGAWGALLTFWSGGTLLLTFALAARFGALAASFGALCGLAAAWALRAVPGLARARTVAAVVLIVAGLGCAVGGLRLI